jgi:hypothetical protein
VIGICSENCSGGFPVISTFGIASCAFDGATTSGDWAIVSTTVAGDCHDAGSSVPATTLSTIGRVLSTNASAGSYSVLLQLSR